MGADRPCGRIWQTVRGCVRADGGPHVCRRLPSEHGERRGSEAAAARSRGHECRCRMMRPQGPGRGRAGRG